MLKSTHKNKTSSKKKRKSSGNSNQFLMWLSWPSLAVRRKLKKVVKTQRCIFTLHLSLPQTAWRWYRLSHINVFCINLFYSPKEQSLKFSRKNIENWQNWKSQFFLLHFYSNQSQFMGYQGWDDYPDFQQKAKGQIISECPYEIIVCPKIATKKFPRFLS